MSSMLEQAIVDAAALKEAALKNAETQILEKYAPEIKDAVDDSLNCGKPAVIDVAVDPNALYSFRRDSFEHKIKN